MGARQRRAPGKESRHLEVSEYIVRLLASRLSVTSSSSLLDSNVHAVFVTEKNQTQPIPESNGSHVAKAPSTSALYRPQLILPRRSRLLLSDS